MHLTRRRIVVAATATPLLLLTGCGTREARSDGDVSTYSAFRAQSTDVVSALGVEPPTQIEYDEGLTLLEQAPSKGATPLEVARYFAGLTVRNKDGERYNAEWKVRANPLIVKFFLATRTVPSGDTTAWCAAFVNWCFFRAGRTGSGSASSGSFRCLGTEATAPQAGDVIVFKQPGFDAACQGKGHVGFYLSQAGKSYLVLGGNQKDSVHESTFMADGPGLKFGSIRSAASIA